MTYTIGILSFSLVHFWSSINPYNPIDLNDSSPFCMSVKNHKSIEGIITRGDFAKLLNLKDGDSFDGMEYQKKNYKMINSIIKKHCFGYQ